MSRLCSLLVTGAPLARRSVDVASALMKDGWSVSVSATEATLPWLDADQVYVVTGASLRTRHRDPASPSAKDPDAVVVCPATFNTVGKAAVGIADTYVHSVLCEAIGAAIPTVIVPMVKHALWNHPSWHSHLEQLSAAGVWFLDPGTGEQQPAAVSSGTGGEVTISFDPLWVVSALRKRMGS